METTNLYQLLNIEKTASNDEIKKAYKKLAAIYHPDKCKNISKKNDHEEIFKKISEAYNILTDKSKREIYDEYGSTENIEEILNQKNMFKNMGSFDNIRGMSMFENFNRMQQNMINFNPDIVINISLELSEIYRGKEILNYDIKRQILRISDTQNIEYENDIINISIEPGVSNNHKIYIKNKGNKLYQNNELIQIGNIIVIIDEIPHKQYKRSLLQPKHIYMTQKISVFQALLGCFDMVFTRFDNKQINISINKDVVIKPNTVICVNNCGMKIDGEEGNLYIIIDIEFPNVLDEDNKIVLKNMTNYVETKKKCLYTSIDYITIEELQTLLNTNNSNNNIDEEQSNACHLQ